MQEKKDNWFFCYWDEPELIEKKENNKTIKINKDDTTSNTSRKEVIDQAKKKLMHFLKIQISLYLKLLKK